MNPQIELDNLLELNSRLLTLFNEQTDRYERIRVAELEQQRLLAEEQSVFDQIEQMKHETCVCCAEMDRVRLQCVALSNNKE